MISPIKIIKVELIKITEFLSWGSSIGKSGVRGFRNTEGAEGRRLVWILVHLIQLEDCNQDSGMS